MRHPLFLLTMLAVMIPACGPAAPDTADPASTSPAAAPSASQPFFHDVTAMSGIEFSIDRSEAGDSFMPDSMGSGCALLDYDADDDLDLYVVNGFRPGGDAVRDPRGGNRLFRNDGDGAFTDVTPSTAVGDDGYGMGATTGDIDNDGDVDLFVTNYGRNVLYVNEGDGTFTDRTEAAGAGGPSDAWSSSAVFFDAENDGDLDLYVANYVAYDHERRSKDEAGRPEYSAPQMYPGQADQFLLNAGDGTFTDATRAWGVDTVVSKGLGLVVSDLDDDGRLDLYVANDGEPNVAWMNDGMRFENRSLEMGLAINAFGQNEAGMGVALGDADGDGASDLFVTHLVQQTNTLYRRRAPGQFEDATVLTGLAATSLDPTGFGVAFFDADLDGDLDLAIANGRVRRGPVRPGAALNAHWQPYAEPNQFFLNDGRGRFTPDDDAAGPLHADVEVSRGLAAGDLDNDGDIDLVVTNGNGSIRLYRNDAPRTGDWVRLRVRDPALGRDIVGARVTVEAGSRTFLRESGPGGSYLVSQDPRVHMGLGAVDSYDRIIVVWPDGEREEFPGGPASQERTILRGTGSPDLTHQKR